MPSPTITASQIMHLFHKTLKVQVRFPLSFYTPWVRDKEYIALPKEAVEPVLLKVCSRSNPNRPGFYLEVNDCDDFSGWLDEIKRQTQVKMFKNSGIKLPLAFGQVWGSFKSFQNGASHQCNFFLDENITFWRVEPQSGKVDPLGLLDRLFGVMI